MLSIYVLIFLSICNVLCRETYLPALQHAKNMGIPVTIHCGEVWGYMASTYLVAATFVNLALYCLTNKVKLGEQ
jgi:hypothetical protein